MSYCQQQQQQQHQAAPSAHFRIDWRQLSYFGKSESYFSRFFNFSSPSKSPDDEKRLKITTGGGTAGRAQLSSSNEPKQILNSLDGCFKSGQLSAILGPSGAGKSTFISTLFGSKQEGAFGQTKVTWFSDEKSIQQGLPLSSSTKRRSLRIASLPQHDHLLHHLTVYETLMFASKIKNATRQVAGKNFHRQNVKRVAKMLKLSDCLDTRCGKLSGGQYKRVSIGQELLSEPDVIILDEPTSGLDAMTCLTTVQTLKSIVTKHPISIILTIHQPDIDVFSLFDHVYVIAQGGLAIYEGPPGNIMATLARVNLHAPSANYNPARFIVENAFVVEAHEQQGGNCDFSRRKSTATTLTNSPSDDTILTASSSSSSSEDEDDRGDGGNKREACKKRTRKDYIQRSIVSLTEVVSGKEMLSGAAGRNKRDRKPLLNIGGIQTLDGKLITCEQLTRNKEQLEQSERWSVLKKLNQIQKSHYHCPASATNLTQSQLDLTLISATSGDESNSDDLTTAGNHRPKQTPTKKTAEANCDGDEASLAALDERELDRERAATTGATKVASSSSAKSDYSSQSGWSEHRKLGRLDESGDGSIKSHNDNNNDQIVTTTTTAIECNKLKHRGMNKATSVAYIPDTSSIGAEIKITGRSLPIDSPLALSREDDSLTSSESSPSSSSSSSSSASTSGQDADGFVVDFPKTEFGSGNCESPKATTALAGKPIRLKRQFDKRLSAKHNCSKKKDYPVCYHAYLLAHRTWLSIIRDPIFFGIQACMHTTIPILLAFIFGSTQEEGCPRIGNFDLVDFAYSDSENLIQGTVSSIRKSISNVGIVFLEMFVLSFSINCITALVFPLDMYVLLKEYRNGWYSLRSYFFGRTLADLPIPIVLHSIGIAILYFLTGQPASSWRFGGIVILVILTSMVAQSVGLTIGALLMKSPQSAVLAAAGIVAPFFALSGFIVRIHTLPLVAQIISKSSYLYHLLNGFIILRYGFGRCKCQEEDFEQNSAHQVPNNLHTLASIWVGTYSEEYQGSAVMTTAQNSSSNSNRTNIDPNIDVVDKMMTAFKMATSYGHEIKKCEDVLPYPMLDFNLVDHDIYKCFFMLILMLIVSRCITFFAIYYKIRSFA